MKISKAFLIPCALLLFVAGAYAQSPSGVHKQPTARQNNSMQTPQFFRLKFVVKELEGKKVIDSRTYTTEISATPPYIMPTTDNDWRKDRSIRADARVPFVTGNYPTGSGAAVAQAGAHFELQYVNVGTDIDCTQPVVLGQKLAMQVTAHITSAISTKILKSTSSAPIPMTELIYPDNHWSSEVLIPIGQPTVLFTSEEPTSTRTLEFDVTATPIH